MIFLHVKGIKSTVFYRASQVGVSTRLFIVLLLVMGLIGLVLYRLGGSSVSESPNLLPLLTQIEPVQGEIQNSGPSWTAQKDHVQVLASYTINARVLSKAHYSDDRWSKVSPEDLALGWGPMARDEVLSALKIHQSYRWFSVHWDKPPLLSQETLMSHSANVHILPGSPEVFATLSHLRKNDQIQAPGYLVRVWGDDQWSWKSSLSRTDEGNGACEVFWVTSLKFNRPHSWLGIPVHPIL